jgi:rod shape-determining protein MreD
MFAVGREALAHRRGLPAITLTLAAAGAVVAALLEVTLWPYLEVGGGHPHLVLIGAIVWATVASIDGALAWGFAGGLMLDVLGPRPLGASALALLVSIGIAAVAARALAGMRLTYVGPLVVALPLSLLYSLVVALIVAGAEQRTLPSGAVPSLVPGALLDLVLAVVIGAFAIAGLRRREETERVGW